MLPTKTHWILQPKAGVQVEHKAFVASSRICRRTRRRSGAQWVMPPSEQRLEVSAGFATKPRLVGYRPHQVGAGDATRHLDGDEDLTSLRIAERRREVANAQDCPCYNQYPNNQLKVCMPCQEAIKNQYSSHGGCAVKSH